LAVRPEASSVTSGRDLLWRREATGREAADARDDRLARGVRHRRPVAAATVAATPMVAEPQVVATGPGERS